MMQWHVSAQEKGREREKNNKVSENGYQKINAVSLFCSAIPSCCVQLVGGCAVWSIAILSRA